MKKWCLLFVLSLVACSTRQPIHGTAIDDMNVALHQGINHNQQHVKPDQHGNSRAISKALMPDIKFHSPRHVDFLQRRFDVAVRNEPAHDFLTGLVLGTPVSMVVSPKINGNITLSLKQVTVEQVLQALEDTYDYTYNRIPGGFEVLPNTMQTQIFSVNYLELSRSGNSDMKLHSGEVTEVVQGQGGGSGGGGSGGASTAPSSSSSASLTSGSSGGGATAIPGNIGSVTTKSTSDFWFQLKNTLENMIGQTPILMQSSTTGVAPIAGTAFSQDTTKSVSRLVSPDNRSVTINPLAGVVVVRATTKELKQVQAYLDMVQNSMDRQVILEVKILEVTLNNHYLMGIDWHLFGMQLNSINDFPTTDIKLRDFIPAYGGTIRWSNNFSTTIKLLETQGNVQVLSSPRVSTMNNQQSLIKVGNDEFFVSGISPGQAALGAVAQPTEQITPFFTGITLDVTPQIDVHGDVTLHVHPSVSLVTEQIKELIVGTAAPVPVPLAHSTIRESDTIVHAKNGQVVIIGGLMANQTIEDVAQLPFFGNIPFLGTLFRATKQTSQKSELVILIKPTVINRASVNRDLMQSTDRLAGLKRGFHVGGRPDVFGNEGEEPIVTGPKAGFYNQPHKMRCRNGRARC